MNQTTEESKIKQILEKYIEGWTKSNAELLKSIWDTTHESVTYLPVEYRDVLVGNEAIQVYYDQTIGEFPVADMTPKQVLIDIFDDVAHLYCSMDMLLKKDGSESMMNPRLSFVLKRKGDRWLVIHYSESLLYESEE